jgi:Uma2 family endonuclease
MSIEVQSLDLEKIEYPDSDGEPLSDNNEQLRLIFLIKGELDAIFDSDNNVAVEGDLLWYPVQGQPLLRRAPDTMVIFGRPKRYRGSYRQWEENNIPPQVAFEILSPGNTEAGMLEKRQFYEQYGVEEYYQFNPENGELLGWRRVGNVFQPIPQMNGWISPRLGIRFTVVNGDLRLFRPDSTPFRSHTELSELAQFERQRAEMERLRAEQERQLTRQERRRTERERQRAEEQFLRAEQARQRAEAEQLKAETERLRAEAEQLKAGQERQRAETERLRAERLAAKLRELKIDPETLLPVEPI